MMRVPAVNLLPGATLEARARRRWTRRWAIAVVGGVVAVALGGVATSLPALGKQDAISRRLDEVHRQIKQLDQQLPAARAELESVRRRIRASERVQLRPDWGALLAYLDKLRGEEVVLQRVGVSTANNGDVVLTVTGLSGEQGREGALVLGLERSGLFEQTTLVRTQRVSAAGGERISFEVRGVFAAQDRSVAEVETP